MFTDEEKNAIVDYLKKVKGRVYIGCDSVRSKITRRVNKSASTEWYATYAVVLVVHINNSSGGKIFHYTERERDYSINNNPRHRLMTEVYKSVECYLQFADLFAEQDREVEIHLDVNSKENFASNSVAKEAIGYVKGVTGVDALIKPIAFSASFGADHVVRNKPM